jgi:hypothetical protein
MVRLFYDIDRQWDIYEQIVSCKLLDRHNGNIQSLYASIHEQNLELSYAWSMVTATSSLAWEACGDKNCTGLCCFPKQNIWWSNILAFSLKDLQTFLKLVI